MPTLMSFSQERPIFVREYSSGTYGVAPYFLGKLFVDLPFDLIRSIIIIFIVYWTEAL